MMRGQDIREARKRLGYSQREVSELLECSSQGALSMIETYNRHIPQDMQKLAVKYLFSEEGKKRAFVAHELTALLQKCDSYVDKADYIREADGEEYVTVIFKVNGSKRICVTADSLSAITRDVLNHI